jgi:glycosyltransferase involved in cell wall biosynthesis
MNILFVDQFSELGGAQRCLLDLLPAIESRGWRAYVAAPGSGPLKDRVQSLGMDYYALPEGEYTSGRKGVWDAMRFARTLPTTAARLRQLIREYSIDLVYVNGPRLLPAACFANRPVVFHAHSVVTQRVAQFLETVALRRAAADIIAQSEYAAAPLRPFVPADRMNVIYNGVPDVTVGQASGLRRPLRPERFRDGPWRIGFIGRIAPEKGALDFVRAARIIAASRDNVQFVVCGAPMFSDIGYGLRVRTESRDLPVMFCGWQDDVSETLRLLDLVVVPSASYDAAPRVIPEAFSASIPVVAYPSGGISELVDPSAGLIVPECTPDSLALGIGMLLDRPEQLHEMGLSARRVWAERFQVERYWEQVLEVLQRVCPGRGGTVGMQDRQGPRPSRRRREPGHIQTAAR